MAENQKKSNAKKSAMRARRDAAHYRKQQALHTVRAAYDAEHPWSGSTPWDGPRVNTSVKIETACRHILSDIKGRDHALFKKWLHNFVVAFWKCCDPNPTRRAAFSEVLTEGAANIKGDLPSDVRAEYIVEFDKAVDAACRLLARTDIWPEEWEPLAQ